MTAKSLSNATGLLSSLASTSSDNCKALDRKPNLLELILSIVESSNAAQRLLQAVAAVKRSETAGATSDSSLAGTSVTDFSHQRVGTSPVQVGALLLQEPRSGRPEQLAEAALVYFDQTKLWAARLLAALVNYWSVFAILHSMNFHDLPLTLQAGSHGAAAPNTADQWLHDWAAGASRLTGQELLHKFFESVLVGKMMMCCSGFYLSK